MDEFQFWSDLARSGKLNVRERAEHFNELFNAISKDYGGLQSMSLLDAMELVELTQDTLDEVWKQTEVEPPYPENRMQHLMDIIGKQSRIYKS